MKTVLTIAGSDSSGGAGIQADLKTMSAHGVYGMSVITALTAQNTLGVRDICPVSGSFVRKQLDAVMEDIFPDAIKIGMLPDIDVMEEVAAVLKKYKAENVVLDPVLSSTSGTELSAQEAREFLLNELFPLCSIVTPNIPEAEIINKTKIESSLDAERNCKEISEKYGCSVLIKGGHSTYTADNKVSDCFYIAGNKEKYKDKELAKIISDNEEFIWISSEKIDNPNTHGTGCTLSSAIACNLALGYEAEPAVRNAKKYVSSCIAAGLKLGQGRGPMEHVRVR